MTIGTPQALDSFTDDFRRLTRTARAWTSQITDAVNAVQSSGSTADRPTRGLYQGRYYFDTTLGQPIWWTGSAWVDALGTPA